MGIMEHNWKVPAAAKWIAAGLGVGAASYAAYVAATWSRYGEVPQTGETSDALLDRFMPVYEVADRHETTVKAPAEVTFAAACAAGIADSALVRALFRTRELIFGRPEREVKLPSGLLAQATAIGWGTLAEIPGREIVFGAVTQPWKPDVTFRAIPAEQFASFDEPGYVKIAWTLRAEPAGASRAIALTETRAATTDAESRARFRWYWSFLSPGIKMIRLVMLAHIRAEAERRVSAGTAAA
jgi:hypothetical protein